jgi:uncharacterized protein YciI
LQPEGIDVDKGRPDGRPTYYLVESTSGPEWDHTKRRREQARWDAHAAFMDALAEEGFVLLGGPVGEGDGDYALLVVSGNSEAQIRARLADDPWAGTILTIASVKPWSVWLRAPVRR